jgi:GNAT superfamily N-acetyltransferase
MDLAVAIAGARDHLGPLAAQKQLQVDVHVDASLTGIVLDPAKFRQVLYNYMSNALKFTPDGGRVTVRARPEDPRRFRVEVEDTGPGIAPGDLSRLFVAFQQLETGRSKAHQGTGPGLALTKRLVSRRREDRSASPPPWESAACSTRCSPAWPGSRRDCYAGPGRGTSHGHRPDAKRRGVTTAATVEQLAQSPAACLGALIAESEAAGLRFVRRLADEWTDGTNRFDRAGEALFIGRIAGEVVGVCGLNVDPYTTAPATGRVRHLYVGVAHRRRGVGGRLVASVIEAARGRFDHLRLRTHNPEAAALYERLGFRRRDDVADCTHVMELR